jgi:hypothetical protein
MNEQEKTISFLSVLILAVAAFGQTPAEKPAAAYHKPADVAVALKDFATRYPALARLESIGKSAGGREIQILRLAGPGQSSSNSSP